MPPNATESEIMDETSMSYTGSVSLADVKVPEDFGPNLTPAIDHNMFFDSTGRRKRLWVVTVPSDTDPVDLQGAKLKKNKCVSASKRFDVTTRARKEHQAIVVRKEIDAVALRMRIAGTISLRKRIEIPELEFALPEDRRVAPTSDARQRFVPFGSEPPKVHSKEPSKGGKSTKKKRKRSEKHRS